jgi:maltose alpha-D-glucosyltransferase/alpha-amylase
LSLTNNDPLWYKNAIFYELHIRSFADSNGDGKGDLQGIITKLDYLKTLGIDCIWLLPMFPSPLKDDGYDISDFFNIHLDYGTVEDLKALVDEAHTRGIRVITDLVLNHTSDEHPWFIEARKSKDNPYRDYYVWSDTDQKYQDARIIFVDTESSNWAYDETTGQYYWHRFYASQPDLNYDNPVVADKMIEIIRYWLDMGIDGFRADAVPYLFEREGTNCENLPETHAYLKRIRAMMEADYPGTILLGEANQWPWAPTSAAIPLTQPYPATNSTRPSTSRSCRASSKRLNWATPPTSSILWPIPPPSPRTPSGVSSCVTTTN